jgi:hypothetical protein
VVAGDKGRRRRRTGCIAAVAAALAALGAAPAAADEGEWLVGGEAIGELPAAAGAGLTLQRGLGDTLSARVSAGGRYERTHLRADLTLGLVWAWDVLAWVPELFVGGGVRAGSSTAGEVLLSLGVRHFVSLDTSITAAVSGGYRTSGDPFGALSVGLWWRLP